MRNSNVSKIGSLPKRGSFWASLCANVGGGRCEHSTTALSKMALDRERLFLGDELKTKPNQKPS